MALLSGPGAQHLIQVYGLWALFALVLLESAGIPLPGETALISAALYAGATHRFTLPAVILVAFAAAVIGDGCGYALGRTVGLRALVRHGRRVGMTPQRLRIGEYLFLRHGGKIVFFGRFVALLRVLAAILAGANRMAWPRFAAMNALGGLCWSAFFAGGAFLLGDRMRRLEAPLALALLAVVAGLALLGAWTVRRQEERLLARACAALDSDRH
ncbi:MAG: hypothetical protein QOH04_501 [Sphingomonadales bacterium]|jgi:membrane protein DedA with SNARE-associated domain|nr:hypothetical protein [Sphingomonadales bacterium]